MSKDFFNEDNEAKSNWFKFEKVGDSVKGTLLSTNVKPARDMFPEQEVYELQTEDGAVVNVASSKSYVRGCMKRAKVGQIVGFKYDSDYQTEANKAKGMAPAKTIKVYIGDMDPEFNVMSGLEEATEEPNIGDVKFD